RVAGVDAGRAGDAFDLQAVPDVDAGRTYLDAGEAVDAVAERRSILAEGAIGNGDGRGTRRSNKGGCRALAVAAWLAARDIVADDQRVAIEHRALEARVRTHVLADLLAQDAGIAVRGKAVEQGPEDLPAAGSAGKQRGAQLADRGEEADEGEAGPQRERDPHELLGRLARELGRGPG